MDVHLRRTICDEGNMRSPQQGIVKWKDSERLFEARVKPIVHVHREKTDGPRALSTMYAIQSIANKHELR